MREAIAGLLLGFVAAAILGRAILVFVEGWCPCGCGREQTR
jgi:Mg/Co/Ni transporter MgtE